MKYLLASLIALMPLLAQHNTGGLERGELVKGELTGDQVQTSVLPLSAGQYLRLILDQPLGDPDADARLYGPDGTLVAIATPMVALQALIQRTGTYRVEVRVHEKQGAGLRYRLRVVELRPVADVDDDQDAESQNALEAL